MELTTFYQFPQLPAELRLNIWKLHLPSPRLVPLSYASVATHEVADQKQGCTSTAPIPTNLHINHEARSHTLETYKFSFALTHRHPKVWFNDRDDVLYFPAKKGWLESWNHLVNAISMIEPAQLQSVRRLAVHETLFKGVPKARHSERLPATCTREFWEYIRKKFVELEKVVVVCEVDEDSDLDDQEMRAWREGVVGCVLGENGVWIGSAKDKLVGSLEIGLGAVRKASDWVAPKWDVVSIVSGGEGFKAVNWLGKIFG